MEKKNNNEPMLPMMDFNEEPIRNNTPLSFIDDEQEPQEERIPTNRPLRFDQDDEDEPAPQPAVNPKPQPAPQPQPTVQPKVAEQPKPQSVEQPKPQPAEQPKPQPIQQPKPAEKPMQQPVPQTRPQQPAPATRPLQQPEEDNTPIPKEIRLCVVNNAGASVPNFNVNGKPVDYGQKITFRDEREVYELTISADGFKDRRIQVTRADRKKGEKRVALVSQAQSFIVGFNTPEGIKRGQIEVEQTSPIYEYIKESSHTDTPLNMLTINGVGGGIPDGGGKLSLRPFIFVFVVGLLLGIGVTMLFASGGSDEDKNQAELVEGTSDNTDDAALAENKEAEKPAETLEPEKEESTKQEVKEEEKEEEKAEEPKLAISERDIKYFKGAEGEVWRTNQVESDAGRKMMSAFSTGNIEFLIGNGNAYNSVPSGQRNGYYNKLLNDLQKLKTQTNYEDVKKTLANECRNGNVDLREVLDKMHRMLL